MPRIGLVTTKKEIVTGVTIFMELLESELVRAGYEAELVRPSAHSFGHIPAYAQILTYAFLRGDLGKFDLLIGNGYGLTAAVDMPVRMIDNIHSTNPGCAAALSAAYLSLDGQETSWLEKILPALASSSLTDLPRSFAAKGNTIAVDLEVAKRSERIIAVSPSVKQEVITHFGIAEEKIDTVWNGIEDHWSQPRQIDPWIEEAPLNVVYSGRASYTDFNIFLKGFDRVLAGIGNLGVARPLALLHLSRESIQPTYGALMDEQGIEYQFNVPHSKLHTYLRPGDIYVMTSRYEAFSLSLAEAMASGLAPISFRTGIAPQVIQDGVNGYLVDSVQEMRERVIALSGDPLLRTALGQAAAETARHSFGAQRMVDEYRTSIEKVLHG